MPTPKTTALIGARGYTGRELIKLLDPHPHFQLRLATSRRLAGTPIAEHVDGVDTDLEYQTIDPDDLPDHQLDAVFLALPNDTSQPYVDAIDASHPDTIVVDLSSDHRFDPDWQYGQPERFRTDIADADRIANPGCYATGAQLTIAPFVDLLDGPPQVFGVSGYSGAGTSPSPRNDTDKLEDNLMPYKLTGHTHEREVGHHIDHDIRFTPHVAPFFRGITLTITLEFAARHTRQGLLDRLRRSYADEPLIELADDIPLVRDNARGHHVAIGGLQVADDGTHATLVATLDNLLKGAATQALQNLNLACNFDEWEGIPI